MSDEDMSDPTKITISRKLYDQLVKSQKKLEALEGGGVDNWEWYDECMSSLEEENDE